MANNPFEDGLDELALPSAEKKVKKYIEDTEKGKKSNISGTMETALLGLLPGVVATIFGGSKAGAQSFNQSAKLVGEMRKEEIRQEQAALDRKLDLDKAVVEAIKTDAIGQRQAAISGATQKAINERQEKQLKATESLQKIKTTAAENISKLKSLNAQKISASKNMNERAELVRKNSISLGGSTYLAKTEKEGQELRDLVAGRNSIMGDLEAAFKQIPDGRFERLDITNRKKISQFINSAIVKYNSKIAELGALSGDDLKIIKSTLPDPNTVLNTVRSKEDIKKIFQATNEIMDRTVKASLGSKSDLIDSPALRRKAELLNKAKGRK